MRAGREIVERRLAKIKSTYLGWEDHGIFTFMLDLDYGDSGQGFGNYGLDDPIHENGQFVGRRGTAQGMQIIMAILKACGVDQWEKLPGRTVYALIDKQASVRGLAPLPTESGTEFHMDDIYGDE